MNNAKKIPLANRIVSTLESMFGTDQTIALHEPDLTGNEERYTRECIESGWVSSVGGFVDRFEETLAEYTGAKRAIAIVNGTAALHLAMYLVGVKRDEEVLVPALSFIATSNAVHYLGAIPHFVDCCDATLGIDVDKLDQYLDAIAVREAEGLRNKRTGRIIRAIVPMHTFGHSVDLNALLDACRKFGIDMVEDAAESLGSFYRDRHTGTWGKIGALSFNGNKIVTTGGGGALLINDEGLADRAKHVSTTAKIPHPFLFDHDELGFNYRLPNINAAMGSAQMERLDEFVEAKRRLASNYQRNFENVVGVQIFSEPLFSRSNYWLNTLLLDAPDQEVRDDIIGKCHSAGFSVRPAWNLLSGLPMNAESPRMDLSGAQSLVDRVISLPSSSRLIEMLEDA